VFRKIRSPHTLGDEPLHAGISTFHLMFFSALHASGKFLAAAAVPSPAGPRQLGQLAASAAGTTPNVSSVTNNRKESRRGIVFIQGKRGIEDRRILRPKVAG
jgi:hypothetical protein